MYVENVVDASPEVTVGTRRGEKVPGNIFDNPLDPTNLGVDAESLYMAPHNDGIVHLVMDMGAARRVTLLVEVYEGVLTEVIPAILRQFPARIAVLYGSTASGPWTQAVGYYNATEPTELGYARIELPGDGISHFDAAPPPADVRACQGYNNCWNFSPVQGV
jgi:hypothetical protein